MPLKPTETARAADTAIERARRTGPVAASVSATFLSCASVVGAAVAGTSEVCLLLLCPLCPSMVARVAGALRRETALWRDRLTGQEMTLDALQAIIVLQAQMRAARCGRSGKESAESYRDDVACRPRWRSVPLEVVAGRGA